jgi:hypothetical protein
MIDKFKKYIYHDNIDIIAITPLGIRIESMMTFN